MLLRHSGFLSSIHKDNLTPWYEAEPNEVIEFQESNGKQRNLNSLVIETDEPLYVQILPSDHCVLVNGYASIDDLRAQAIKVLSDNVVNIRWYGCYF